MIRGHLRLGKKAVKLSPKTLKLERYLDVDQLPTIPDKFNWATKVTSLGIMKNDDEGDCVYAAEGHQVQAWTANNDAQEIPSDDVVEKAYSDDTGFVKGDETTDNGAVELDALTKARKGGLLNVPSYKLDAFAAMAPKNHRLLCAGTFLFGGLFAGAALPKSAQRQEVWDVAVSGQLGDPTPGSWGGHAFTVIGINAIGPLVVSWGEIIQSTWAFVDDYWTELYALLSPLWARPEKISPSGFAEAILMRDMRLVTA